VREQPWGKDIVVIALTGWGRKTIAQVGEAGFDGHLVKPVDYDKLLDVVGVVNERARESRSIVKEKDSPNVIE
jgi:two-component system CheB/CheR fusion protein